MENDPEGQLYKDIDLIRKSLPKLQCEMTSLKGSVTKVSNRVAQLEAMDFHTQIIALDEKLKSFDNQFNLIAKSLRVLTERIHIEKINLLHTSISAMLREHELVTLSTQLIADTVHARQQIKDSAEPSKIVESFKANWVKKLRESGIDIIEF